MERVGSPEGGAFGFDNDVSRVTEGRVVDNSGVGTIGDSESGAGRIRAGEQTPSDYFSTRSRV